MKSQFSLFDLLLLIGIVQGIITGILLLTSKKNKRSNKFLAFALFSFCFLTTKTLLHTLDLWDTHFFRFFPNGIELALAPLIYFYVRSLVHPTFSFKAKDWLHFVPFFISQAYSFVVYFLVMQTTNFNEKDSIAERLRFNEFKQLDEYLLLASVAIYLFYSYREIKDYKNWLDNTTSDGTYPDFRWIKDILVLSIITGVFLVVNHSLDILFDLKNTTILHYHLLILFIAFEVYYLGLKGYLQPDYVFNRDKILAEKVAHGTLSDPKILNTVKDLEKAMKDDKIFLNPKLNIYELSTSLEVPQKSLSLAINTHFQMSFRDFINGYRLEEVKAKLKDENYNHMSILGIAMESGFNSEASFYRIFKKSTGVSPKEFMDRNIAQ